MLIAILVFVIFIFLTLVSCHARLQEISNNTKMPTVMNIDSGPSTPNG